jgi:DNA-binding response OmpR family regulator/class 3 adenylate cyclase
MADERILVVDDGAENREFLVNYILQPNGFLPLVARDGLEGMEMARAHHPDLILLDLQMPRMNGMEVLDALNAERLDIPVILMTFHGSEEVAIEVYRKGVRDYVKKPYTVDEMLSAIEKSLSEVRLRREKDLLTNRLLTTNTELNQRLREMRVLDNIGKTITAQPDFPTLISHIAEAALNLTSCEESSLYLLEGGNLRCKAIARAADGRTFVIDEIRPDPLVQRALQNAAPVLLTAEELAEWRKRSPSAPSALMVIPLIFAGQAFGGLMVRNITAGARVFTPKDAELLGSLADYAAIALQNTRASAAPSASAPQVQILGRAVTTDILRQANDQNSQEFGHGRYQVSLLWMGLDGHLAFARKAPPEQIITLLNGYLSHLMHIAFQKRATLLTQTSDSLLWAFNAPLPLPNHPELAFEVAWHSLQSVTALNKKRGGGLGLRLALHRGEAVFGYFGAGRHSVYTALGESISALHHLAGRVPAGEIWLSQAYAQPLQEKLTLEWQEGLSLADGKQTWAVGRVLGVKK